MGSSTYRRSKSLAADAARWWSQLKFERGNYLDSISTIAKLVKSLLDVAKPKLSTEEHPINPRENRVLIVEDLQELIYTMIDAYIEVERSLIDIMGNDLVKPLTPKHAIDYVQIEAKQLDLILVNAKKYLKVVNRLDSDLDVIQTAEFIESPRTAFIKSFETFQNQVIQTETSLNVVYDEMTKQRELADLLEKKQLL